MNQKNFNKFYLSRYLVPNSTRFDCHKAVCLPDDVQECLWIQEATDKAWISLKQNIIDTAVNERGKHLHACVRTMHPYFKQFCCRSWKTKQLDEMLAKVSRKLTKYVIVHYLY